MKACAGQNSLTHCWQYLLLQTFDEVSWQHEKQKVFENHLQQIHTIRGMLEQIMLSSF